MFIYRCLVREVSMLLSLQIYFDLASMCRHVVAEMLPIDISLLCDFIEKLCGFLVLSKRLQLSSTLHNVTLPKSWLISLAKDIKSHRASDTKLYSTFIEPMLLLLSRMHANANTGKHRLHNSTTC
jgi:hypothetical protein